MLRLRVLIKNVGRELFSSLKSFAEAEDINKKNLKVLFLNVALGSSLTWFVLFLAIWMTHVLIASLEDSYKFLFSITVLIPVLVEWKKQKSLLDIILLGFKVFLVPLILIMLFKFELIWDVEGTYKELSIESFFKDMTFSKSFFGACFGMSLYFDRILEYSSLHIKSQHPDLKRTLTILRDVMILFLGLHFGLSFFILGIVCLAIKDSYFLYLYISLFKKQLGSNESEVEKS